MKLGWKTITLVAIIVILIGVASIYFSFRREINAPNEMIVKNTLIKIEENESTDKIGADLAALDLIKSSRYFNYYEFFRGKTIKPGYYEITPLMSLADVADLINSGATKVVKVTFPEGYRLEQVGQKLSSLDIVSYSDFVEAAAGKEGTLFPDTYFFDPIMTADSIIAKMTNDYAERTAGLDVTKSSLILASIVEKEAGSDADRGIIAGIYLNRLNAGMKLQSDPTVSYGRDSNNIAQMTGDEISDYVFWKPAKTVEFTSVNSIFNTYIDSGLPPAPICNPGLASIKAALSPIPSNYYYFLYGSDGKFHPAKTQVEHSANVVKYL